MMTRWALGLMILVGSVSAMAAEPTAEQKKVKEALQELNEFIGSWKGTGGSETNTKDNWTETLNLGWKFGKEGDTSLQASFEKSKLYDKGVLNYDPKKKVYTMSVVTKDDKKLEFSGEYKRGILEMVATDAASKDKVRLTLSTNNEGARLVYNVATQNKGRGIFKKGYQVAHTREGVSIASGKKQECVVTGGLGTMTVSHMGKTYYVCCTGCRDAFNEEPAKFVKEFEAKQKK